MKILQLWRITNKMAAVSIVSKYQNLIKSDFPCIKVTFINKIIRFQNSSGVKTSFRISLKAPTIFLAKSWSNFATVWGLVLPSIKANFLPCVMLNFATVWGWIPTSSVIVSGWIPPLFEIILPSFEAEFRHRQCDLKPISRVLRQKKVILDKQIWLGTSTSFPKWVTLNSK